MAPYIIGISSYSNSIGIAAGLLLSTLIVKTPDQVPRVNFVWMLFAWMPIIGVCFIRERPQTKEEQVNEQPVEKLGFRKSLKMIARNREFWLTTLLLVFQIGLSWSIMTLIGYFSSELKPVALKPNLGSNSPFILDEQEEVGYIGVGFFAAGMSLGFFAIKVIESRFCRFRKHKLMRFVVMLHSLIAGLLYCSYGAYGIIIGKHNIYTTTGLLASSGVWALSTIPMGCALIQEYTPAINEAISVGINFWLAQATSVLIIYLSQECTPLFSGFSAVVLRIEGVNWGIIVSGGIVCATALAIGGVREKTA